MLFAKLPPFNILQCDLCRGAKQNIFGICRTCHGMKIGTLIGDKFVYFSESLTAYYLGLRRARRILNYFRLIGGAVFGGGLWLLFSYLVSQQTSFPEIFDLYFWQTNQYLVLFWLGIICWSYFFYRLSVNKPKSELIKYQSKSGEVKPGITLPASNWSEVGQLARSKRCDLSRVLTIEAKRTIEDAYNLAQKRQSATVTMIDLFLALLNQPVIGTTFIRLGVSASSLKARAVKLNNNIVSVNQPVVSDDVWQIIFHAYQLAVRSRQEYLHVTELLSATVDMSEPLQEMLYDWEIEKEKLANVIEWTRVREKIRHEYQKMQRMGAHRSKYGLDRAMTAIATPYLNNFSQDLTMSANHGYLGACVAREAEIEEIFQIIAGGRQNVVLVGEAGVGKMSVIEGIAQRMVEEDVPERLRDKRMVQVSVSSLLAGTTISGAQDRLIRILSEISRAGNIILFIDNISDLMAAENANQQGMDVSGTLAEYLSKGNFFTLATSSVEAYNKYIINSALGQSFARVEIKEMTENQAIQALESKAGLIEYQQKVFFSYNAIEQAVVFAGRFLHEQKLPASALEIMTEAATLTRNKKGENNLVLADDVAVVIAQKTGIPATNLTANDAEKLLQLEQAMHERVVGQDEAVNLVANALRRARAEIRSKKKPIANFLFLGPTGVGKTELAKTIAEVYFGGEERMIRIDMSEYQDKSSIYRLIGAPGQKGTGILTEAVRQKPFSLVLLDELEKADPDILNLFLQVFDDGRLTDSVGRVIDFTSTIIIATSNAGTSFVQTEITSGKPLEEIRQNLIKGELKKYYRPEFLNRFDGIVLFRTLLREEIKEVARLMLVRVGKDLLAKGIELKVEDTALESLADAGFDPEFGARPMRRAIQDKVENQLAELLIQGKLKRKDVVVLGEGAMITVS